MTAALHCFPANGVMSPILENVEIARISPAMLDARLVTGWRHFGTHFFRYNFALHEGVLCGVVPLRVRVADFAPSKSQRRILRRNADLVTRLVPAAHGPEYDALFRRHRERFRDNVPDSLHDFLSPEPASIPGETRALEVRHEGRLLAVSFLDIGKESTSSIYAAFEPAFAALSLGHYTLLREIAHAQELGKRFHYLGYAYTVPSVYDYKKRYPGVEGYDWGRGWTPLPPDFTWSRKLRADETET